jgi:hypothetical protein
MVLARHEPDFQAAADRPLSLEELLAMLGDAKTEAQRDRQEAIACYLSASEGWTDAVRRLGGAFATEATELRERKAD